MSQGVSRLPPQQPLQVFSVRGLRLHFPAGALACGSVSLPSCPSRFICMRIWDRPLHHPLPRCKSSPPGCPSPPLPPLAGLYEGFFLAPWFSDSHTVRFSVSSGCFLFLNCCSFGCARRQVCLPMPPSWPEVHLSISNSSLLGYHLVLTYLTYLKFI